MTRERIEQLKKEGHRHMHGGKKPEEVIPTPNGAKRSRSPDITTEAPNGTIHREQVGRVNKSGEPVARERRAMDDIEAKIGQRPHFTPYKKK